MSTIKEIIDNIKYKPIKDKIKTDTEWFVNWVKEIIQDPEHYYTGEEFALTIRSFTYGYDIFTPSKILAWHRCHFNPLKKHYTNNSQEIGDAKHRHAMERLRKLIEGEDLGIYSLGNVRTVEDYGNFAGIDFKNKALK